MSDFFEIEKRTVKTEGGEIVVLPFKVSQIARCAKLLKPIAERLSSGQFHMLDLLDHIDVVIEVAAISTGKSQEEIGNLELDTMFAIVLAVIEVNSDFFVQAVLPRLTKMLEETAKAKKQTKQ